MIPFLKEHERLLLGVFVLAVVVFLGNKWLNDSAARDNVKVALAQKDLDDQKQRNADLDKQTQSQAQMYQQLLATVTAQNDALAKAMAQRNTQTAAQQKADQVMPLPDLAVRWETLLGLAASDIQNVSGNLVVSDGASRATVGALEMLPTLKQNLADEEKTAAFDGQQITSLTNWNQSLQQEVVGLKTEIVDDTKLCQTKIDDEKAKARKGKRNWFITGLVTGAGIVARIVF